MSKILHRFDKSKIIIKDSNLSMKELVEKAIIDSTDLKGADLKDADLRYAYLKDADLRYADLRYADLRYAYLKDADLRYAYLKDADLRYADLKGADLRNANLSGADLRYADLSGADLRYAYLKGIKINEDQKDDLLKAIGIIKINIENKTLRQIEIEIVKEVIEKNKGNISSTAKQLEIGRNKIYRLIKE